MANTPFHIPVHKLIASKPFGIGTNTTRRVSLSRTTPSTPLEHVLYNDRRSRSIYPSRHAVPRYGRGHIVRSNVHKYVEFISVDQIFVAKDYHYLRGTR